jgi:electron transfer flavoprotein beta subunit
MPAVVGVLEGINLPRYPSVPGRIRAKSKPVAASNPARPDQRLEMIRLVVPEGAVKQATILGSGASAAVATVDMFDSVGVL